MARRLVAAAGGDADDLSAPRTEKQIEEKFRSLTEDYLGAKQVSRILERLWSLDDIADVGVIAPMFTLA